jgi:mono/diheme cytochrome c family protein
MIDRWPFRHGTALGIGLLVLLTLVVVVVMQRAADGALPMGFAGAGEGTFADHCGDCHGYYAGGTDAGPGLIVPGAADALDAGVVERAVRRGAESMPAVTDLGDQDIADIIAFLRDLQADPGF